MAGLTNIGNDEKWSDLRFMRILDRKPTELNNGVHTRCVEERRIKDSYKVSGLCNGGITAPFTKTERAGVRR